MDEMDDVERLTLAIDHFVAVRDGFGEELVPDRDSTLAKAEYHLRGVRDELLEAFDFRAVPDELEEAGER